MDQWSACANVLQGGIVRLQQTMSARCNAALCSPGLLLRDGEALASHCAAADGRLGDGAGGAGRLLGSDYKRARMTSAQRNAPCTDSTSHLQVKVHTSPTQGTYGWQQLRRPQQAVGPAGRTFAWLIGAGWLLSTAGVDTPACEKQTQHFPRPNRSADHVSLLRGGN